MGSNGVVHAHCYHARICKGVVYCVGSEIVFIRTDLVPAPVEGWGTANVWEKFARIAADTCDALRGLPISAIMMVARHIELPMPGNGDGHALGTFYEMEKAYPEQGVK